MENELMWKFGLVLVGMVAQFIKKMADLEAAGTLITPWQYCRDKPWRTLLAINSGFLAAYILHLMGELNNASAIAVGLACTEIYDSLRARAVGRIGTLTGQKQAPIDQSSS